MTYDAHESRITSGDCGASCDYDASELPAAVLALAVANVHVHLHLGLHNPALRPKAETVKTRAPHLVVKNLLPRNVLRGYNRALLGAFVNERLELGTKEAADLIGVTVKTLAIWRKEGRGPAFFKLSGKLVYYNRSEINAWIGKCRVEPNA